MSSSSYSALANWDGRMNARQKPLSTQRSARHQHTNSSAEFDSACNAVHSTPAPPSAYSSYSSSSSLESAFDSSSSDEKDQITVVGLLDVPLQEVDDSACADTSSSVANFSDQSYLPAPAAHNLTKSPVSNTFDTTLSSDALGTGVDIDSLSHVPIDLDGEVGLSVLGGDGHGGVLQGLEAFSQQKSPLFFPSPESDDALAWTLSTSLMEEPQKPLGPDMLSDSISPESRTATKEPSALVSNRIPSRIDLGTNLAKLPVSGASSSNLPLLAPAAMNPLHTVALMTREDASTSTCNRMGTAQDPRQYKGVSESVLAKATDSSRPMAALDSSPLSSLATLSPPGKPRTYASFALTSRVGPRFPASSHPQISSYPHSSISATSQSRTIHNRAFVLIPPLQNTRKEDYVDASKLGILKRVDRNSGADKALFKKNEKKRKTAITQACERGREKEKSVKRRKRAQDDHDWQRSATPAHERRHEISSAVLAQGFCTPHRQAKAHALAQISQAQTTSANLEKDKRAEAAVMQPAGQEPVQEHPPAASISIAAPRMSSPKKRGRPLGSGSSRVLTKKTKLEAASEQNILQHVDVVPALPIPDMIEDEPEFALDGSDTDIGVDVLEPFLPSTTLSIVDVDDEDTVLVNPYAMCLALRFVVHDKDSAWWKATAEGERKVWEEMRARKEEDRLERERFLREKAKEVEKVKVRRQQEKAAARAQRKAQNESRPRPRSRLEDLVSMPELESPSEVLTQVDGQDPRRAVQRIVKVDDQGEGSPTSRTPVITADSIDSATELGPSPAYMHPEPSLSPNDAVQLHPEQFYGMHPLLPLHANALGHPLLDESRALSSAYLQRQQAGADGPWLFGGPWAQSDLPPFGSDVAAEEMPDMGDVPAMDTSMDAMLAIDTSMDAYVGPSMDFDVHDISVTPSTLFGSTENRFDVTNGTIDPSLLGGAQPVKEVGSGRKEEKKTKGEKGKGKEKGKIKTDKDMEDSSRAYAHMSAESKAAASDDNRGARSGKAGEKGLKKIARKPKARPKEPVAGPSVHKNIFAEPLEEGKRKRKKSARALAGHLTPSPSRTPSEGGDVNDWSEDDEPATQISSARRDEIRALATQPTGCHHCRRSTAMEKMRCTIIKESGEPCGMRFCVNCIVKRYPEIQFDAYARVFECPRCLNTCNCTVCCRKRGETYIPAPRGRIKFDTLEFTPNIHPHGKGKGKERSGPPSPSPSPSYAPRSPALLPANYDKELCEGMYWGAVYTVTGERIGGGFVSNNNSGIVVKDPLIPIAPEDSMLIPRSVSLLTVNDGEDVDGGEVDGINLDVAPPLPQRPHSLPPRKRVFVGALPPTTYKCTPIRDLETRVIPVALNVQAYVGNKCILELQNTTADGDAGSFGDDNGYSSPLSPLPSDEESGNVPETSGVDVGFAIANALMAISIVDV
ncbi:uncharacterized protein FIBRA_01967 [Fibroporia radiculosa]|uniref:Zinc-finger domain-containing protein n=1 Tax=Fibroporia radiculosa TaxID=599839 RepID=J4HU62_9APHY|nr:uncharacterized protein FIBRA_01967 [Fibroporia radiculosa]CCL99942.1 predicted protein [Fibroporia radiculosa]